MSNESDIPTIELPKNGFQSRIPEVLLAGKTDEEKFILTEVSKMSSFVEWAAPVLVDSNRQARRTNGRVSSLEEKAIANEAKITTLEGDKGLQLARFAATAIRSKYFWIGTAVFVLIGLPWLIVHSEAVLELVKTAVSVVG